MNKREVIARVINRNAWRCYDCLVDCGENQHGMRGDDYPLPYSVAYGKYGCRTADDFRRYMLVDGDIHLDVTVLDIRASLRKADEIIAALDAEDDPAQQIAALTEIKRIVGE